MASLRHSKTKMLFYIRINKAWLTVHVEKVHLGVGKMGGRDEGEVIRNRTVRIVCYDMEIKKH